MRARYFVGSDDYKDGIDEYESREDAEAAALDRAQDEEKKFYIWEMVAHVKTSYEVVSSHEVIPISSGEK